MLSHRVQHPLDLVARIDDHGFTALLIADHRAVALQRPDRKYFMDHTSETKKCVPRGTHFHKSNPYFFAGAGACCCVFSPANTEPPVRRACITDRVIEVSIKIMAHQVVSRVISVAAPRGPKAVWLPWPPKAAAKSALCPLCTSTTMIKNKQTIT